MHNVRVTKAGDHQYLLHENDNDVKKVEERVASFLNNLIPGDGVFNWDLRVSKTAHAPTNYPALRLIDVRHNGVILKVKADEEDTFMHVFTLIPNGHTLIKGPFERVLEMQRNSPVPAPDNVRPADQIALENLRGIFDDFNKIKFVLIKIDELSTTKFTDFKHMCEAFLKNVGLSNYPFKVVSRLFSSAIKNGLCFKKEENLYLTDLGMRVKFGDEAAFMEFHKQATTWKEEEEVTPVVLSNKSDLLISFSEKIKPYLEIVEKVKECQKEIDSYKEMIAMKSQELAEILDSIENQELFNHIVQFGKLI